MRKFSELFSAFDYLDEIVYIADMDTHELVYCNRKARNLLQNPYEQDQPGYKCYKCIQNLDHPCDFCNNEELKREGHSIWTHERPEEGRFYMLHDDVITVDDKKYRMELAMDITEVENRAEQTRQMLDMENHLTECVRKLVNSEEIAESVDVVLQTVLSVYDAERSYVFEFDWDRKISNNTYEICAPGISSEIDNLQEVPIEYMHFWLEIFKKNPALIIEDVDQLIHDSTRKDEYKTLSAQGIKSIIAVPIYTDNQLTGFVGVDNPKKKIGNADFLINLAYFIGTETNKNRRLRELKKIGYHDPLTGIYNRKGFEQIVSKQTQENLPIGFAVMDIDNFKVLNDTYGHDVGDEVLKDIANILVGVFRNEDTVFRLGGDEFAVLLNNCDQSVWKTFCSKIGWIHSTIAEKNPNLAVTLSVGICFTTNAYSDKIYHLADDALYETKRNGRAGCTMIVKETREKKHWKDHNISALGKNVLEYNNTGIFQIEIPINQGEMLPQMICGDVVKEIFDIPADANPEECYKLWRDGVEPSYTDALKETARVLLEGGHAECTYEWMHPKFGRIFVRSSGTGTTIGGKRVLYGYHHSLKNTEMITREDDSKLLLEAVSSIYFGTYYVNLIDGSYYTIKSGPNEKFLQVQENLAQDSLKTFVYGLVRQTEQAKMLEFIDLQTLPERMKTELHLDCEYYSTKENGWCRASFIPVKRDKNGELTHVLFEVTPLDTNKAHESEVNEQSKKTLESFYNHVQGGLVTYEWDGKELKILQASRYYEEQYGESLSHNGGPDYKRVHPEDVEDYQRAIYKALTETHTLDYTYRVWNKQQKKYLWTRINAVSEEQPDGTSLVYAMYSDVTGQKEAELRLRKRQASLNAALFASNQLCYEYDPLTHEEECLTEDRIFHYPKVLENYPECMEKEVHPDDWELFLDTIHSMEKGIKRVNCNIRLKNRENEEYTWYAYNMFLFYDSQKDRDVVIISVMDISEHMDVVINYDSRMRMLTSLAEESISLGMINISENVYSVVQKAGEQKADLPDMICLDDYFESIAQIVIGEKKQAEFREFFERKNLISRMQKGEYHLYMEYMCRLSQDHIEWVRTSVDMIKNPFSGDIDGVCYTKSIQDTQLMKVLLEKTLKRDYPLAAVVYAKSEEYYLFNAKRGQYCVYKQNFWNEISDSLDGIVSDDNIQLVRNKLTKERTFEALQTKKEFTYAFDCVTEGRKRRLEVKINYLDESKEMLLATLRDITDSIIMDRLIHDNERDFLTNLYNRRKTFEVCKKLLEEHPEDQFAMLHFDIRHFRLYNTFFGEEAGDQLLRDIANMFRKMNVDYKYWAYGRIESDVFCVFFPINHNKYQKHLDDLLHGLQDYRQDFLIEPAIGIYKVTDPTMSMEAMFSRASIAAKTVRSGVTNSIIFYNENMEQNISDEQQVVNEMQLALEQKQFQVYLQPKYSLDLEKPVGAEALVRWKHPQKGMVSPGKFIPVFERNGFIAKLDRYMWEEVCILLKKWKEQGQVLAPVSVNVSRISMYNPTTVSFLKELVMKYDVDPRYLELELTESAYMDEPDEMKRQLKELQEFGFHILMDDFGSGYSSLNTLRELPVDCLKLDMKFLSESCTDQRGRRVLEAVINLSKLLQLSVIAEGVETKEQADFLRMLRCEYAQGYLYAKPMPVDKYEQILKNEMITEEEMHRELEIFL